MLISLNVKQTDGMSALQYISMKIVQHGGGSVWVCMTIGHHDSMTAREYAIMIL